MMTFRNWVLCGAMIMVTACADPDRFGPGSGAGVNGTSTNGLGSSDVGVSALDPTSIGYFNQTVGNKVLFAVDQSTLSPEARQVLQGQAAWLTSNPSFSAVIEGHADEQGTREYNLALGARRANAVRDFLVSQGVATNRMETLTFGKERPLEICSSEACYAANRRALTNISGGLGS